MYNKNTVEINSKKRSFLSFWPIFTIILIECILFLVNYKAGTFLVGWDNLFPEFNFSLNFKRDIFAIWQQYRGLGLIDGMSHAANLVHDIQRWILSLFLPLNLIRWVYVFLMHCLGGIGMYILIFKLLLAKSENKRFTKVLALFGALFYQYNFGVIQQFFLPFEVFIIHFAFLPWLIFFTLSFIKSGKKSSLIGFAFFSLFSVSQAHVPSLFIVYAFSLFLIIITAFIFSQKKQIKRIVLIILIAFSINAYWGLPFIYSTLTNASTITQSKNFQMATNDIFYRNHKYGDFQSVSFMKGLTLGYQYLNVKTGQQNHHMMQPWLNHIQAPLFYIPAWIFFLGTIIGLALSIRKRQRVFLPFAVLFLLSFFMMGTAIPFIGSISFFLRNHIPLFHTIFRFTFTKFSIIYALSYTIMLVAGINYVSKYMHQKQKNILFFCFSILIILAYTLPSFKGNFFYENLASSIPSDYFQTFNFFKNQSENKRIVYLPVPWYWAWLQPNWGTIGSGFVWYGIPQPLTDIAFTPWSDKNENFYWELDQAVFSENPELLYSTLKKHDINWIYLDENIKHTQAPKMSYHRYEKLIEEIPQIKLEASFGKILIYRVETERLNDFIGIKLDTPTIGPSYSYDNYDAAYLDFKDYATDKQNSYQIYYPFRSLFSGKNPSDQEFQIHETNTTIQLTANIPKEMSEKYLAIPYLSEKQYVNKPQIKINNTILKESQKNDLNQNIIKLPLFQNGKLTIIFQKKDLLIYESLKDTQFISQDNSACNKDPKGTALLEKQIYKDKYNFTLTSQDSKNCIKASLPNLEHRYGYLLSLQSTNDTKRGFAINVFNETYKKSDIDVYLDSDGKFHQYYFVIAPRQYYGLGYTIFINNDSEGKEKVKNTLHSLKMYKLPFYFLKHMNIVNNPIIQTKTNTILPKNVSHPNMSMYTVNIDFSDFDKYSSDNLILYLSQGYNSGWKAYEVKNSNVFSSNFPFLFGKELKEHILINNWANGWKVNPNNSNSNIIIIFLPQYLQYIGFALLIFPVLYILFKKN